MRCQSCGTMNEPGFRFCGSCGARHEGSAVSAAPGNASGGGGGAVAMGGQQLVSDGVGVAAPAMARPRRMTDAGAEESLGLPRRSKAPLVVLLAVDAALAVGGALLLRAGLASPGVADAATEQTERSGESGAAATEARPQGKLAAVAQPAGGGGAGGREAAASAGSAASAPPSAATPPPAAAATDPATAPAATENAPASATDKGGASAPAAEPEAPASSFAPGEPALGTAPDRTADRNEKPDDAAARKKKKEKRASGSSEGPVDPYAPAPDLSSQINKLFTKGQSKLDKCHSSIARGEGPSQLTLSFRVMADGSLGGIRVLGAPAGAEMLGMCVTAELAKWKVQSGESGEFVRRIQFR